MRAKIVPTDENPANPSLAGVVKRGRGRPRKVIPPAQEPVSADPPVEKAEKGSNGQFEKGKPRHKNAGIKKGGEWWQTIERKKRAMEQIEQLKADYVHLQHKSVQEIFDYYEFNPIGALVRMVRDFEDEPMTQFKALQYLISLQITLIKETATVSEQGRVQVTFGREFNSANPASSDGGQPLTAIAHEQIVAIDLDAAEAPEKLLTRPGRPKKPTE